MKDAQGTVLSKHTGKQTGRPQAPSAVSFFVIAEIGARFEDQTYPVPPEWENIHAEIGGKLMELVASDAAIKLELAARKDQCVVVCVKSLTFPENSAIVSPESLKRQLQPLLLNAASAGPPKRSHGPLISGEDLRRGQLMGTVLLLDHLDAAKAYCDKIKSGELRLPHEREQKPKESRSAKIEKLKALLDKTASGGFPALAAEAMQLLELTKQEMAARLTPALNAHLEAMPHETYQDKQAIASWVNGELRQLGLAICCPKTGKPAILIADIRGGAEEASRMRLEVRDDAGHRMRTWTGNDLPQLELMEDMPRQEGLAGRRSRH